MRCGHQWLLIASRTLLAVHLFCWSGEAAEGKTTPANTCFHNGPATSSAPDSLPHALSMSHMHLACSSTDRWPYLSNSQVQAPSRVPALQLGPFESSWLSLVFTGNWHYYLLIAITWQQWTYLQHVSRHLLLNINTKGI